MPSNDPKSKQALDKLIRKSRVHLYKPMQIAEILYHQRSGNKMDLNDLESYRNISKKWRDEVSTLLVGRHSTSSQKYQDNVFEANAMPPQLLADLGEINIKGKGLVEAYVYRSLEARLSSIKMVEQYISNITPDKFSLKTLVKLFTATPGLRRSIDKIYEILVYALFSTVVRALNARVTLEIDKNAEVLRDFERFIRMVLGIDAKKHEITMPAALYRVGVTNAADRGLDIWANFGPAVQVKHLTLTPQLVEDIIGEVSADRIVIVCLDAEKKVIESLLKQVGWNDRIQGIITINDLDEWYQRCLSAKYRKNLGANLLKDVSREFANEFPTGNQLGPFMKKRGYDKVTLPPDWKIVL